MHHWLKTDGRPCQGETERDRESEVETWVNANRQAQREAHKDIQTDRDRH